MIILLLFFISVNANSINNDFFSAQFDNNKILLTNNYNKFKISYGYLAEDNTNKETKIDFNNIYQDNDYSINYVKTSCSSSLVNIHIINKMFTNVTYQKNEYNKITKYTNDKLYITMNINTWKNRSKDNDLILDLNFDNNILLINDYQYSFGNYIITFPNTCNVDSHRDKIFIDKKYSNKLLIHFPYHENQIMYTYTITKNVSNNIVSLYWIIVIFIMCLSYVYYKYRRTQYTYNNYNYNYNYYGDYKYKYY